MNKLIPLNKAMEMVQDSSTLMINGFMAVKSPETLIDGLVKKGVQDLTIIANDAAIPGLGIGKLLSSGQIKKITASHIGLNPEAGKRMHNGTLEVELIPQGTLAERIRCGGAGLGGVLTPTGIGTAVEEGKQKIVVNDQEYLLEIPLRAEIALIKGSVVDKIGNVYFKGTTKNFSLVMAMACDIVIVEAETLVETGELDPDLIMVPSLFVDHIILEDKA